MASPWSHVIPEGPLRPLACAGLRCRAFICQPCRLRAAAISQQALVVRRVGDVELGLYARRDYLERRGTPSNVADLRRHSLIGFDHENAFIRSVRERGFALERGMFALRSDSDLAQLAALRAGFGIGVCQVGVARRSADLVRLLPKSFSFKLEMWLAMHADLRSSARCRVVADALAAGLAAYAE